MGGAASILIKSSENAFGLRHTHVGCPSWTYPGFCGMNVKPFNHEITAGSLPAPDVSSGNRQPVL